MRVHKTMPDGTVKTGVVESTLGRFIFNEIIPQDLGFVDRSKPENELVLEIDFHVAKKQLKQILEKLLIHTEQTKTAEVLDDIKSMGYKVLYKSGYDRIYFRYDGTASETGNDCKGSGYGRPHFKTVQTWSYYRGRALQRSC